MEKLYLKRSWRIGTCLMVLLTFFALSLSAQNRKVTGALLTSLVIRFQVLILRWLETKT